MTGTRQQSKQGGPQRGDETWSTMIQARWQGAVSNREVCGGAQLLDPTPEWTSENKEESCPRGAGYWATYKVRTIYR